VAERGRRAAGVGDEGDLVAVTVRMEGGGDPANFGADPRGDELAPARGGDRLRDGGVGEGIDDAVAVDAGLVGGGLGFFERRQQGAVWSVFLAGREDQGEVQNGGGAGEPVHVGFHVVNDTIGPHMAGLIGDAQHDPALASELERRLVAPARVQHRELLHAAQRAGELRADVDVDLMADALFAPIWFRLLVTKAVLSVRYADEMVTTVMSGWTNGELGASRSKRPRARRSPPRTRDASL
jgi:hypothetical protein